MAKKRTSHREKPRANLRNAPELAPTRYTSAAEQLHRILPKQGSVKKSTPKETIEREHLGAVCRFGALAMFAETGASGRQRTFAFTYQVLKGFTTHFAFRDL
jgi:hypothetical protein